MPIGYSWKALVRYIPDSGDVATVNLTTVLVDVNGVSRTHLTRHRVTYEADIDSEENVNRDISQVLFGFRRGVVLGFDLTNMANHAIITRLHNRFMDPNTRVQLSLDNGTTYVDMVMVRAGSPIPHRGKTLAGARFDITVKARSTVDELLPIGAGVLW